MPRRKSARRRIILPLAQQGSSAVTETYLPTGTRISHVIGENDSKPDYDFSVIHRIWNPNLGAVSFYEVKFPSVPNGTSVNLKNLFPSLNTKASAPLANGDETISTYGGTGTQLQVYYLSGGVNLS